MIVVEQDNDINQGHDVWSLYLFALKSSPTRERYKTRLDKFFNFINLEGKTVKEKSNSFIEKYYMECSSGFSIPY
jgi:hypothetical protein